MSTEHKADKIVSTNYPDTSADLARDTRILNLLNSAVQKFKSEHFEQAELLCQQVLQLDAQQPDALHITGIMEDKSGNVDRAIKLIRKAVDHAPNNTQFHENLGLLYLRTNQFTEASGIFRQLIKLQPDNTMAYSNLATALLNIEDYQGAIKYYSKVVQLDPGNLDAHQNIAFAYTQSGSTGEALEHYQEILNCNPDNIPVLELMAKALIRLNKITDAVKIHQKILRLQPESAGVQNNTGNVLLDLGEIDEARKCFLKAIEINPELVEAYNNLGIVCKDLGQDQQAIMHFKKAVEIRPDYADAYSNIGGIYKSQGKPEKAEYYLERAISINPYHADAHNHMGNICLDLGRYQDAIKYYREAIELKDDYAEAYNHLGNVLIEMGQFNEAMECFNKALELDPGLNSAHWNRSFAHLLTGEYEKGWQEYEWRFKTKHSAMARHTGMPLWQGEDLGERTLLVYAEQGIGDEIRFANCIPDVIKQAKHVVVECDPRLQSLYQRSFPEASVVGVKRDSLDWLSTAPPIDLQIAVGSLPMYTRTRLEDFPQRGGYLTADPERVACWKERLQLLGDGARVGIAWRGGLLTADRKLNYADFKKDWRAILEVPGVQFINMMYDKCDEELEWARNELGVDIHSFSDLDQFNDMEGVAALMSSLDLMISAPLSVSEMAGALAVPTWYMLFKHHVNTLGSDHLPWFPNTRCFFMDRTKEWGPVARDLAKALQEHISVPAVGEKETGIGSVSENEGACEEIPALLHAAVKCYQSGDIDETERLCRNIITLDPLHADALHMSGLIKQQHGDLKGAMTLMQMAIKSRPKTGLYYNSIGEIFLNQRQYKEAGQWFQMAVDLEPENAGMQKNLADTYLMQTMYDSAIKCYQTGLSAAPNNQGILNNLGNAYLLTDDISAAITCFNKILAMSPDNSEIYNSLGVAYRKTGQMKDSIDCLKKALQIKPDYTDAHDNLGLSIKLTGDFPVAIESFRRAISLNENFVLAKEHLASALTEIGQIREAGIIFKEILMQQPENPSIHWDHAYTCFLAGNLAVGWQEHEWRFKSKVSLARHTGIPLWQGEKLCDRTLLVYAEQGIGDEIRFASCIPEVIKQAKHIVIECDPRLQSLYQRSFPEASVVGVKRDELGWLSTAPPIDLQIAIGSLPMYTRTSLEDFPRQGCYLSADPERVAYWERQLQALGSGPWVGIAWRGGLNTPERDLHYPDFKKDMAAILKTPGIQFINMMYDECSEELEWARTELGIDIHHFSDLDQFNDMEGVAALLSVLDLMITVPIAVSEMAGALAVPTWYMIFTHHVNTLGTDHLPWFPHTRCFFKERVGEWGAVTEMLAQELLVFSREL
mgnify:CR=1 FL=1